MAYSGYLLKIGTYEFPPEWIEYQSYKVIRSVQDLDSYRDANGVLHRNALSHILYKTEFQARIMTNTQFDGIMNNIRNQFIVAAERKVMVDSYIPEEGIYTGAIPMYMPDLEITIQQQVDDSTLKYAPITFKFIGY